MNIIFPASLLETLNLNDKTTPMRTADFQFDLPPELIAQHPAPERGQSRLMVLHRKESHLEHKRFPDLLSYLRPGDVLVLNDSRVIPARLRGVNARTGGKFEMLLAGGQNNKRLVGHDSARQKCAHRNRNFNPTFWAWRYG